MDSVSLLLGRVGGDLVDREGKNILYHAASAEYSDKYIDLLRILLKYGVPPEPIDPSHLKPFTAILENGDLESVQLMIDHGIDLENYADELPLHEAARNPRLEVLKFLLSTEIFDLNASNEKGRTALFDAVQAKNFEAVELLLNWGSNPNLVDHEGIAPLQSINYDDETEAITKCVESLLRHGADPDAEDIHCFLVMASTFNSEHDKRVRLFLEHGVGQKNEVAMYQALRILIMCVGLETLQLYMKRRNINLSECKKEWCLSLAVNNRHVAVLEYLLNTGVFDPTKKDRSGMNPLCRAVIKSNSEAVEMLLDWGVEVDLGDGTELTPLHIAACRADREGRVGGTKDAAAKCIELLLLHGADINCKHLDGETVFEMAMPKDISQWAEISEISPVAMSILAQANLLESQGKHLNSKNFYQREAENKRCQAELEALKAEIIGDSVSLYNILSNGNSRLYSKKPELTRRLHKIQNVRSLEDKFPVYGRRLVKIVEHVNLREVAANRLSRLVGLEKDSFNLIIEKILRMLSMKDLRALIRL